MATWTRAYINDLPDSAFLHIESGGKKDAQGRTTPRSLRHFPYKDSEGKVDLPHLRNAISRIPQANLPQAVKDRAQARARSILGQQQASVQAFELVRPDTVAFQTAPARRDDEGQVVQRFRKDLISVGTYTHPVFGWTLQVDEDRMDRWVAAFDRMADNGVVVEVVKDHSAKADDKIGELVGMERDGETLHGLHEFRGEDAIELASRVRNVSIAVDKDFRDGKGVAYGEAIVHSALVQQPLVPGQEPFEKVAASRFGVEPVLVFGLNFGSNPMKDEVLAKLREKLGLGDELTEDTLVEHLGSRLGALTQERDDFSKRITALEAELKGKEGEGEGDKGKKAASQLPVELVEQMAATGAQRLDLLVQAGKITPAVRDKLSGALIGNQGERSVVTMSVRDEGARPSILNDVVAALEDNDIVKLGEQTGQQVTMSRETPGAEDNDADLTKEMIAAAE